MVAVCLLLLSLVHLSSSSPAPVILRNHSPHSPLIKIIFIINKITTKPESLTPSLLSIPSRSVPCIGDSRWNTWYLGSPSGCPTAGRTGGQTSFDLKDKGFHFWNFFFFRVLKSTQTVKEHPWLHVKMIIFACFAGPRFCQLGGRILMTTWQMTSISRFCPFYLNRDNLSVCQSQVKSKSFVTFPRLTVLILNLVAGGKLERAAGSGFSTNSVAKVFFSSEHQTSLFFA